ncbi:methylmalonyl-CoA epimerase [Candidatus Bathyarchaeota archaeon]|nr:MAG: methylmalonyl-CoA epimerase [Candidatus Bathyarchaeota archaeon]
MFAGIHHVGIAVKNLDEALEIFQKKLGLKLEKVTIVEDQKVKSAMLSTGGETRIELLEPTCQDSPVGRFLEKRGEGIHHVAFKVKGIEELMKRLKDEGLKLVNETPRKGIEGKIAFIHPKSVKNVLVELCEEE